jgi:hypothetical protein
MVLTGTTLAAATVAAHARSDTWSAHAGLQCRLGPQRRRTRQRLPTQQRVSLHPATVEFVANGLASAEGPLWLPDGRLIVSDVNANLVTAACGCATPRTSNETGTCRQ